MTAKQRIPDAPPDSLARAAGESIPQVSEPDRLVVLLVEDDDLIRLDAADMLRTLGHEVVDVEYGPDALLALAQRQVDVLVTDVGLPGMPGTELAERARQLQPGIGLVFATGDTELESRNVRAGAIVLCKPYDSTGLARSLLRALGCRAGQGRRPGSTAP